MKSKLTRILFGSALVALLACQAAAEGKISGITTKPVGEGTGLGLSVTYSIIERHKGTISVESRLGRGTTFTISIPVDSQPAEEEQGDTSAEPAYVY